MVPSTAGTGFQTRVSAFQVTMIAAVSDDGYISSGTGVPWNLPADRAHFRSRTAGRWLLVGRRTHDEMTGWFHDHHPLVLSSDPGFRPHAGHRVATVAEALEQASASGADELVVIGGGQVYALAMPWATRLDITRVHTRLGGGVPFPPIDGSRWTQVTETSHPADHSHALAFTFTEWVRTPDNGSEV